MQRSNQNTFDIAIIGGGPAGVSAAIYCAYEGKTPILFESESIAYRAEMNINAAGTVQGYPGLIGKINGAELVKMYQQSLEVMKVDNIVYSRVVSIQKVGNLFELMTEKNIKYWAKAIILCMGTSSRKLKLENVDKFLDQDIYYFAYKAGTKYKDKKVAVLGGANAGATAAKFLASSGAKVTVIELNEKLSAKEKHTKTFASLGIETRLNTKVTKIIGDNSLKAIEVQDIKSLKTEVIDIDGLFIYIGTLPNNQLAQEMGITVNSSGYIEVNTKQETNVPGVFAAGNLCGGFQHIVVALGQGATAAHNASLYIQSQ